MYNMLEFSSTYSDTTGSLWFYSKDEAIDFNKAFSNTDYFDFFKHTNRLVQATVAWNLENVTTAVPFKYLSNFWRSLDVSSLTVIKEFILQKYNWLFQMYLYNMNVLSLCN